MSDTPTSSTTGMKAVAVIVAWMSLAWFNQRAPFNQENLLFGGLLLLTATVGIVAAVAIWRRSGWMMVAYVIWLALTITARTWHDAQIEPVAWKVAVGAALLAIFWGAVGFFLYREQRQLLDESKK